MRRLGLVIAAVAPLVVGSARAETEQPTPEQRLAVLFSRVAARVIDADTLTVDVIAAASSFLQEALALDPDDPELWRFAAKLAVLADDEEAHAEAIRHIVELDPHDTKARLERLNLALERYNTVEDRIAAYHRLLAPEEREQLGGPVASRLALDLALLLRRRGDLDGFAKALADAVAFDPFNRAAAAIAAGFFRMRVEDPYGEAELLTNLLLADPTDITTQIALAKLLVEQGAYTGAEQLYELATRNQQVSGQGAPSGLLADQAIAQWANGHAESALATIRKRQREVESHQEAQVMQEEPDLDPRRRARKAREQAMIAPTLAAVRAAIHLQRGDEEAGASIEQALRAYDAIIQRVQAAPEATEIDVAQLKLEMAWIAVWLGGDVQRVATLLEEVERQQPLSETARARFDGWLALRRGDVAEAASLLEGPGATDPAAGLGLAEAYARMDRRQDAARVLLKVARAQPGTLIGVSAANQLADLVGQRLPLSKTARQMEALIASIPSSFFRYPESPSLAVGLEVQPAKPTFGPYEPVIVNIVVTNNSPTYPLAIDRDGPIRPEVLVEYTTTLTATAMEKVPPIVVVDIDRRLRLEPLERLVIPVDLRRLQLGDALDAHVLAGKIVRVKASLNAVVTPQGAVRPLLLGSARWSPTIRIDGVEPNETWMRDAIAAIREPDDPDDLVVMALLAQFIGPPTTREEYERHLEVPAMQADLLVRAADAFNNAFDQLDRVRQAWLLSVTPPGKLLGPVRQTVQASGDRLVLLTYLLFHLRGPDDPALQTALKSSDDHLRQLAEGYVRMFNQRSQGGEGGAPPASPAGRTGPE